MFEQSINLPPFDQPTGHVFITDTQYKESAGIAYVSWRLDTGNEVRPWDGKAIRLPWPVPSLETSRLQCYQNETVSTSPIEDFLSYTAATNSSALKSAITKFSSPASFSGACKISDSNN